MLVLPERGVEQRGALIFRQRFGEVLARSSRLKGIAEPFVRGQRSFERRPSTGRVALRSEEHTSELQSPCNLVCRLLLEKKQQLRIAAGWPRAPARVRDQTLADVDGRGRCQNRRTFSKALRLEQETQLRTGRVAYGTPCP